MRAAPTQPLLLDVRPREILTTTERLHRDPGTESAALLGEIDGNLDTARADLMSLSLFLAGDGDFEAATEMGELSLVIERSLKRLRASKAFP